MAINSIAIVGAGTMGGGIAISCIAAGLATRVIDLNSDSLAAVKARAVRYFERLIEKGRLKQSQADAALDLLQVSDSLSDVSESDLVIEAVFEDLDVKRTLFQKLSQAISGETLVATNTSALRVADLADALPVPENFLGLHYFSPAEINPLVEIVSGTHTASGTLSAAREFLEKTGKTPLSCMDANGFVVNRFFCPYTNEAVRILDEGIATSGQIDIVARQVFELPIGPFAVMNIVKPRIMLNAVQNLSHLGTFYAPATSLKALGASEENWQIEADTVPVDEETARTIGDRLRASLFLPVLEALSERVAEPDAFDLGAKLALKCGVPPVAEMQRLGRGAVEALIQPLAERYDVQFPERGLDAVYDCP